MDAGARRVLGDHTLPVPTLRKVPEVLDLVYYHEKSVDEVAEIVGAPANTVRTRMFYARKRMQTLLEAAGVDAH